jgi:hypothetical protein
MIIDIWRTCEIAKKLDKNMLYGKVRVEVKNMQTVNSEYIGKVRVKY